MFIRGSLTCFHELPTAEIVFQEQNTDLAILTLAQRLASGLHMVNARSIRSEEARKHAQKEFAAS